MGEGVFENCIYLAVAEVKAQISILPKTTFKGCRLLQTVILPENISRIDEEAFADCKYMNVMDIPFSVTAIGDRAFSGCTYLTKVSLHAGLKEIGEAAFENCSSLISFEIPGTVTSVGDSLLKGCTSLETLGIYSDTDDISATITEGCTSLRSITTSAVSEKYTSVDGILLSADKSTLIIYPAGRGAAKYTLPDTVTTVDAYAFKGCDLEEVNLKNAEFIAMNAFEGASKLHTVSAKNAVYLGYAAFKDCISLTDITFTGDLEEIGSLCFSGCIILKSVSVSQTTEIADDALDSITTVKYIDEE